MASRSPTTAALAPRPPAKPGLPGPPQSKVAYDRRRPELTALHQAVAEGWPQLRELVHEQVQAPLPRFVERGFEAYLTCGQLAADAIPPTEHRANPDICATPEQLAGPPNHVLQTSLPVSGRRHGLLKQRRCFPLRRLRNLTERVWVCRLSRDTPEGLIAAPSENDESDAQMRSVAWKGPTWGRSGGGRGVAESRHGGRRRKRLTVNTSPPALDPNLARA
jgi:hypothetical protein